MRNRLTAPVEIPPQVARFLELVGKFADVLDSAHLTVLAYKSGDRWTNLTTLLKFGGSAGPETAFDVDHHMVVISARKSIADAVSLLADAVPSAKYQHMHITIHLPGTLPYFLQQRTDRVYFHNTLYDPGQNNAVLLNFNGPTIDSIISQTPTAWGSLEEEIQKLDPPYLGLEDLAESHAGYPIGRGYNSTLFSLLLIPLKILEADIGRGGKLQLKIRRDLRLNPTEIAFGVVVKPQAGVPSRHTVPLSKTKIIQEEKDIETVQLDTVVSDNAEVVIQLRARNELLEATRLYPGISSPRLRTHSILDPNETYLEKALTNKAGKPFEQAVAMLLHLAGFKVEISAELETLSSSRYADILAFTPDEQTMIIGSCVSKNISPQDVTLLAHSYLTTKETLDDRLTIIPIIFTTVPAATLPQSLQEQAQREQIRVCSKEEILKVLDFVRSGAGPREVLKILQQGFL